MSKPITVDFETEAIQDRPHYPPKPVGVSIKLPGKAPKYYAWGHPTENNCSKEDAAAALKKVWADPAPKLFHHAKFDMEVAEKHFGLPLLPWDKWHDTMFLLFLHDPHAKTLALKPASERVLGLPPDEQDAVKDWVLANVKCKSSEWGAHICDAPGGLVGKYANGDVVRTAKLYDKLWPEVKEAGMEAAYNRERQLMPILLENERVGIRLDVENLEKDLKVFHASIAKAEAWLFKRFGYTFNLDSDEEKATALEKAGIITEWAMTPTGKRSTAKKNMTVEQFNDAQVAAALGYRDRLCTCVRMFGESWLRMAQSGDGHVHTHWNQVAQANENGKKVGTRTGRPSTSNPNFLNVSKTWHDKDDGYAHPKFLRVPELPLMRKYLLPDDGGVFLHRDYSQQELRFAAHFEDGPLLAQYKANPRMDVHQWASEEIRRIRGQDIARRPTKIAVFRKIYGGGAPATADGLKCSIDEARRVIASLDAVLPGIKALDKDLKAIGRAGEAIVTWGGRRYFCEPPSFSKKYGRDMTYEFKLINYLIQGSSADATKESIIRYHAHPKKRGRFLVTVYDECNTSAPVKCAKQEMAVLKEAMESIEVDLPMLTDGKTGPSWGELVKEV